MLGFRPGYIIEAAGNMSNFSRAGREKIAG
jgi:hypothetical protein